MVTGPLLVAVGPGVIILFISWWFKKMNLPIFVRIIPGVLMVIAAIILFYIGYVNIRGFEGGSYLILSFILTCFAVVAFIIAKR